MKKVTVVLGLFICMFLASQILVGDVNADTGKKSRGHGILGKTPRGDNRSWVKPKQPPKAGIFNHSQWASFRVKE